MFEVWTCCAGPIVLLIAFAASSVALGAWLRAVLARPAKDGDPVDYRSVTTVDRRSTKPWGVCFSLPGASLTLALAGFCLLWIWGLPDIVFYWELFHFRTVLSVLLLSSSAIATLIALVSLVYHVRVKRVPFFYSALHLVAGLSLVGAGVFFWLALTQYAVGGNVQVDSMLIDERMYNLVSYNSIESHSGLLLYECDRNSILCRQVARSRPDYSGGNVDGRLIYTPTTNELSAEVTSSFRYVGFTYCLREPCPKAED